MKAGDLFINLGITGADTTAKALGTVKGTLGEVSTASLAAKAGILGVLYGIQQLMSQSDQAGTSLLSYAAATGQSMKALQQWQYAADQAGISGEEMQGNFEHLQSVMERMRRFGEVPKGFGVLHGAVNLNQFDDAETALKKINEYLKKEKNVAFANEMAKSFGLTLPYIGRARIGAFDQSQLDKAPLYSDRGVQQLDKNRAGFAALQNQWVHGFGDLNIQFGGTFIKDLKGVSKNVLDLVKALAQLSQQAGALGAISDIFKGWGEVFGLIGNAVVGLDAFLDKHGDSDKDGKNKSLYQKVKDIGQKHIDEEMGVLLGIKQMSTNMVLKSHMHPIAKNPANHTTNVTNHIHGVKDADDVAHKVGKTINKAGKQSPVQGQVN